jgi:hypothetical protein
LALFFAMLVLENSSALSLWVYLRKNQKKRILKE